MEISLRKQKVEIGSLDLPELRGLYESAFPEEERIPYSDLPELMGSMPIDLSVWYDGDIFVGLTMVLERHDVCWFWYFAVRKELRGNGYGQHILARLKELYADCLLILDLESPRQSSGNASVRQRRYGFYLRNGFSDTGIERTFYGVTYAILKIGKGCFTQQAYEALLDDLSQSWSAMPMAE